MSISSSLLPSKSLIVLWACFAVCVCMACCTSRGSVNEGTVPSNVLPDKESGSGPDVREMPAVEPAGESGSGTLSSGAPAPGSDSGSAGADDNVDLRNAPELGLVYCEVKIDYESALYTGQASGPTLEEAMDNAVDEACAHPCAEGLEKARLSEDEADRRLTSCTERCASATIVLGVSCTTNGQVVYTEGVWHRDDGGARDSAWNTQERE